MKAIIWGAGGQDGFYMKALLQSQGIEVIGVSRSEPWFKADLTNYEFISALIQTHKPAYIFHFAANSTTRHTAWKENHDTISTGSIHLLQAVKDFAPECKVFLSGSGLQFINTGRPINENDPFDPSSIYSVCRIHSIYAARYYRSLGLKIYVGYFFHHDSPQRSDRHINMKIIQTAKRIAAGENIKLEIGDLSVKKEFGFAGDIVKGVWQLVQQDDVFEAVIGTGIAHSIEEWVNISFLMCGLQWKDHTIQVDGFVPDFKILVSDPATINSIGWKPKVAIEDLAKMMLEL